MSARKGELCRGVVIELRSGPGSGGVADAARRGKTGRGMIRIAGAVEGLQMTTGAVGGHGRKLSADMTQSTGNRGVRPSKWELCQVVIELCPLPGRCCVARITLR